MKRSLKGRIFLATVSIVAMLGYVGWRSMQPKFKFAPVAEVRAKFDKRLLAPIFHDSAARKRFDRFVSVLGKRNLPAQEKRRTLLSIVAEGPLESPTSLNAGLRRLFSLRHELIDPWSAEAAALAKTNPSEAVGWVCDEYILVGAVMRSLRDNSEFLWMGLMDMLVGDAAQAIAPYLDEKELTRLLQARRRQPSLANILTVCLQAGAQEDVPRLAGVSETREPTLRSLGVQNLGTYDALETAELRNRVLVATLDQIEAPFSKIDLTTEKEIERLRAVVPPMDYLKVPQGPERALKKFVFDVRSSNHPNYWGPVLAGSYRGVLQLLASARSHRGMTEAQLAVLLYRKRVGRLPRGLEEVVSAGLMKGVPKDFSTGDPIQFDVANRKLSCSSSTVILR